MLTLCDSQIPSAVERDKKGICAGPELGTACFYQPITGTLKAALTCYHCV